MEEEKLTSNQDLTKTINDTELATKKKLSSRKFVVWVVWLIIVLLMVAMCIVVSVITKKFDNALVDFIAHVLEYFFAISMMYLGINVTQKGIFALKDYIQTKEKK